AIRFLRFDGPLDVGGTLAAEALVDGQGEPFLRVRSSMNSPLTLYFVSCSPLGDQAASHCQVFGLNGLEPRGTRDFGLRRPIIDFVADRGYAPVQARSWEPVHALIDTFLHCSRSKRSILVAVPQAPPPICSFLGPVRRSSCFIVLELD